MAVVVDYGSTSDAPPGERPPGGGTVRVECVTVAAGANAVTVLTTAGVSLRVGDNGLVCGIDGYPRTECAAIVVDPTPTRTAVKPSPEPSSARPATSAAGPGATATATTSAARPSDSSSTRATAEQSTSASPSGASSAATPSGATPSETTEAPLPVRSGAPVASGTESTSGGGPLGPLAGVALIAVVGAGAWWTARGRQS